MRIFLVALALLLGACSQTQVASYVDPAYRGGAKIRSMAVAGETPQLGEREALESAAVAELAARGVRAVRMIDLVPPTRPGGPAAEAAALRAAGVRAVLRIAIGQRGTITRYNPPAYFGDPFFPYGDPWYGRYPFPGPAVGGTWVQDPVARYEATLQEAQGGAVIWKGEAVTRGGASAGFDDLAARAAKDLVARLQQDGVI